MMLLTDPVRLLQSPSSHPMSQILVCNEELILTITSAPSEWVSLLAVSWQFRCIQKFDNDFTTWQHVCRIRLVIRRPAAGESNDYCHGPISERFINTNTGSSAGGFIVISSLYLFPIISEPICPSFLWPRIRNSIRTGDTMASFCFCWEEMLSTIMQAIDTLLANVQSRFLANDLYIFNSYAPYFVEANVIELYSCV